MLALAFMALHTTTFAQTEYNNINTTGRGGVGTTFSGGYQAIGINPANISRSRYTLSFSFLEGGFGVSSRAFTKDIIHDFRNTTPNQEVSLANREYYAKAFTSNDVLNIGADLQTFAISVNLPKIGGFAFSNRQRVLGHAGFNKNFSELLFLGEHAPVVKESDPNEPVYVSELFDGTELKASWVNEWNISYGRRLVSLPAFKIFGGVGYRYIQGLALYEFSAKNGEVKAYSTASPILNVDYGQYLDDPLFNHNEANNILSPVGKGHGFDIGLSAEVAKIVKLGVSVADIGAMRWTENLLVGQDKGFLVSDIESNGNYDFENAMDMAEQIIDTAMHFTALDELRTDLPTRFRAGVGLKVSNKVELGLDYVKALNNAPGNLTQDFIGLGVDVMPSPFIRLSSGVSTGAGDKVNLPLGIAFVTPVYEFGLSTRDITAPYTKSNPGASLAFAFMRFKIGKLPL